MGHTASATTQVAATVDAVLDVALTVDDMVRWFPLPIHPVDPPEDGRLRVGDACLAESALAGRRLRTRIEVLEADETNYRLAATGPVCFTVTADLAATSRGCSISASVEARSGGGLTGRVLEGACRPLLGTGLRQALDRLARLAEARRPVQASEG
ncbi:MAG: SRPBCC family protein [Solirubrobacterales bacterium]|jgi:hypothetical protein|nr:SRPBCC family protein [Solirubrobacterales bacterium]